MLKASFQKNDRRARQLVWIFSVIVFTSVALLSNFKLNFNPGFNVHVFAAVNAVLNTLIAVLLIVALIAVKKRKFELHKKLMLAALSGSVIFLISYIAHHLLAGEAKYGDINHNGTLSAEELTKAGGLRTVYLLILFSHIFLAAIIMPFILFTAYRALIAEFPAHKKLAKYTWPLWLYIAVTGPIIYLMISPYY